MNPTRPPASAALPLVLFYTALVVYASLFPFTGWHDQGIAPWAFLRAPWPQYWTCFDLIVNFSGYAPLGALLALTWSRVLRPWPAALLASVLALLLSFSMESLQSYLPQRIASNVDFAFNSAGAAVGAAVAGLALHWGHVQRWQEFCARWFSADARGALVLLALWPVAMLSPVSVAYGMGQILERIEEGVATLLKGTPFLDLMPLRQFELEPLLPGTEVAVVALGALVPCLLGFVVIPTRQKRLIFAGFALAAGVGVLGLASALAWGPEHAWAWMTAPVPWGVVVAAVAAIALAVLPIPGRAYAPLLMAVLLVQLVIVNGAADSAYFLTARQSWEQGQFIHFFGLTRWIAWLWPFLALIYLVVHLAAPPQGAVHAPPLESQYE